jgi:hypothetical protein
MSASALFLNVKLFQKFCIFPKSLISTSHTFKIPQKVHKMEEETLARGRSGVASRVNPWRSFRLHFFSMHIKSTHQPHRNHHRKMAPTLSEDEIDDLLYFARTGDAEEYDSLKDALCKRENATIAELLEAARDEMSGNGVLHMAAANDHHGKSLEPAFLDPDAG